MKTLMVLPTYNEAGNLDKLMGEILRLHDGPDIIVIDDSSPDGTGDIADRMAEKSEKVSVIHRPAKSGRGSATASGFQHAIDNGYDYVMEMDVDFSHSPCEIPGLMKAALDADLVIASRFVPGGQVAGWNWVRKLIHFAADMTVKIILGTPNTDHTNGFRCYRVEKLRQIDFEKFTQFGYIGQTLLENIFHKIGFKIKEVPSVFKERLAGESKMGHSEMINGVVSMLKYRWICHKEGIEYYTRNA